MHLTDREMATVLAALRFWQNDTIANNDVPGVIYDDFFREHAPICVADIDALCEKINVKVKATDADSAMAARKKQADAVLSEWEGRLAKMNRPRLIQLKNGDWIDPAKVVLIRTKVAAIRMTPGSRVIIHLDEGLSLTILFNDSAEAIACRDELAALINSSI